ncbi:MAG: DUF3293 domain-containing protein [Luteolibacter sp.]
MKSQLIKYGDTVFEYLPDDEAAEFWVVTACNPDGRTADPGDNLLADSLLQADIGKLKLNAFRIIGMSRDESHAEPGWGIECDEQTALDLGRRYNQEAVFHFTERGIDLVDCKNGKRQPLENPASRIRDPRQHRHFSLFIGSPPGRMVVCADDPSREDELDLICAAPFARRKSPCPSRSPAAWPEPDFCCVQA